MEVYLSLNKQCVGIDSHGIESHQFSMRLEICDEEVGVERY